MTDHRTAATARDALEAWLWRHAGNAHDLRSFAYPGTWRLGYLHCRNCIEDEDFTFTPAALAAAEAPAGVADPCPAGPECDSCRKNREAPGRVSALEAALVWCSGSQDFAPGGVAREGWERIVKPLLDTLAAPASTAGVSGEVPYPRVPLREGYVWCENCTGQGVLQKVEPTAPAPTPSEPVERCGFMACRLVESVPEHGYDTHCREGHEPNLDCHPFTPATRDE